MDLTRPRDFQPEPRWRWVALHTHGIQTSGRPTSTRMGSKGRGGSDKPHAIGWHGGRRSQTTHVRVNEGKDRRPHRRNTHTPYLQPGYTPVHTDLTPPPHQPSIKEQFNVSHILLSSSSEIDSEVDFPVPTVSSQPGRFTIGLPHVLSPLFAYLHVIITRASLRYHLFAWCLSRYIYSTTSWHLSQPTYTINQLQKIKK